MNIFSKKNNSFEKDILIRNNLNKMKLEDLWKLICDKSLSDYLGKINLSNLYEVYFNQKIIHKGISREEYLLHPLRMAIFFKEYFPKYFSKLFILICFHNILEVGNLKKKEIENLFGEFILK